jgi:hypothetical protein
LAELSNEEFVNILQNIHTATGEKSLFGRVLDFLRKVANEILSSVNKNYRGTAYADTMELLLKSALPDQFKITK